MVPARATNPLRGHHLTYTGDRWCLLYSRGCYIGKTDVCKQWEELGGDHSVKALECSLSLSLSLFPCHQSLLQETQYSRLDKAYRNKQKEKTT